MDNKNDSEILCIREYNFVIFFTIFTYFYCKIFIYFYIHHVVYYIIYLFFRYLYYYIFESKEQLFIIFTTSTYGKYKLILH